MSVEQVLPAEEAAAPTGGDQPQDEPKRTVSTISFPYMDLESAVQVVRGVHEIGGGTCLLDQLAAHLNQKTDSSAFRAQLNAARILGVAVYAQGSVSLTSLGARICDPQQEQSAMVDAFLTVPLYKAVYDQFKGGMLPPNKGLERAMISLGVAAKQADRARQVFQRAAQQAGFFWKGQDRLVMPAVNALRSEGQPNGETPPKEEPEEKSRRKCGGDGGGGGLHPLIEGLIKSLPKAGEDWAIEKRAKWLRAAAQNFELIYPDTGEDFIEIKVQRGKAS